MKNNLKKNEKAQVTIFIILGMILVVVIAILFILLKPDSIESVDEENPNQYIQSCVNDVLEEAVDLISKQGGYIEPKNYKLYENEKIGYLCYNKNYYSSCINQNPLLIEHLEEEINNYIKPKVDACFIGLKDSLEGKGNKVSLGDMNLNTKILYKKIQININKEVSIKGKNEQNFDNFKIQKSSSLYELGKIANEIVNQEAQFCYFSYEGYSLFYPQYNIRKFVTNDDIKIYTIKDKNTNEEFKFSIKSCAIPAGFG